MNNVGPIAFLFFGAVYWATDVAKMDRYRLFDTVEIFDSNKRSLALRRLVAGLLFANVLPISWLSLLYALFAGGHIGSSTRPGIPVIAAGLASLSVFASNRILHAMIASDSPVWKVYTDGQRKRVVETWRDGRHLPNSFSCHFWPGLAFLVGFPLLAFVLNLA